MAEPAKQIAAKRGAGGVQNEGGYEMPHPTPGLRHELQLDGEYHHRAELSDMAFAVTRLTSRPEPSFQARRLHADPSRVVGRQCCLPHRSAPS
jgi:hypothetical protein